LGLAPTIFQERIHGRQEVRVTIVGDHVFAASFLRSPTCIDGRLEPAARYQKHELPVALTRRLLALMKRLGLCHGTADLMIDTEGDYWFLEINPQGQFLWIEIQTGMPIAHTLAQLFASLAEERHIGRGDATPPARSKEVAA
jgi:pyruvate carboxylase